LSHTNRQAVRAEGNEGIFFVQNNSYYIKGSALTGPRKWVREMAIPRYPSYPVSGVISGKLSLRGV